MNFKVSDVSKATLAIGFVGTIISFTFQNCGQPQYNIKDSITESTQSQNTPAPTKDPADIVCDPSSRAGTLKSGLVAELYYMTSNMTANATTVLNFFNPVMAVKSTAQIYFSQINTVPQLFDRGFVTQSGDKVKDNAGNILTEWFALKYFADLRVLNASDEGFYEFAALADDGHILEAQIDGVWTRILDNDGLHSPKFGCSLRTIEMKVNVPIPIRVYYYQGPSIHISNVLHWRKMASSQPSGDAECGVASASYFFDVNTSTPLTPYTNLLNRGWKVIPAQSYFLPNSLTSPCSK